MIDILIPVLGRPQNVAPLVENIRSVTTWPHRIIFICSEGDDAQISECSISTADIVIVTKFPAGPGDYAKKINHGFLATDSEWVFMGADDLRFEPRWDRIALKEAGTSFHVVGTNDMANAQVRQGRFGTHCLIRRRYITEQGGTVDGGPGSVLHEGYDHNFVDRELCHVAQSRNSFVFARHSHVKHHHPLWNTASWDGTYTKALSHFREDLKLFISRAHLWNYVGLSAHERKLAA